MQEYNPSGFRLGARGFTIITDCGMLIHRLTRCYHSFTDDSLIRFSDGEVDDALSFHTNQDCYNQYEVSVCMVIPW